MNYLAPQEKDGTWLYTCNNNPIGYCAPFREFPEQQILQMFPSKDHYEHYITPYREAFKQGKYHSGGHTTKEDACQCYKNFVLDFQLSFTGEIQKDVLHKCKSAGCSSFLTSVARVGGYHFYFLCNDHLNREEVEKLYEVGESWQS